MDFDKKRNGICLTKPPITANTLGGRIMNVKFKSWTTPNFVFMDLPPRPRQEGVNFDRSSMSIKDIEASDLADLCDRFRADVFKKAGKADPKEPK